MSRERHINNLQNHFKSVDLKIVRTHSVNYEEPIVDEHSLKGLFFKADSYYTIMFNTEVNGEPLANTIKVKKDLMYWSIGGESTNFFQKFKAGENASNHIYNDKGMLTLHNRTRRLDAHFEGDNGFIDIFYELYSGETHLGFYSLEIMVGE
jgi:uncharacterized beta-barrel protein YwiB (DUF1934 family)